MILARDPGLAALAATVQPERIRDLLSDRLAAPGTGARLHDLALDYVSYWPGRELHTVYRACVQRRGVEEERLFYGHVAYTARAARRDEKCLLAIERARPAACAPGEAFYDLPESDMRLWVFPNDPGLPSLAVLTDPEQARGRLERCLGRPVREVRHTLLRYTPPKRAVLLYDCVVGKRGQVASESAAASPWESVVCKPFAAPEHARHTLHVLRDLCAALPREGAAVRVPRPLHHDTELGAVWMSVLPGRWLETCDGVDAALVGRLGVALAAVHRASSGVRREACCRGELTPARELEHTLRVSEVLRAVLPECESDLERLCAALAEALPRLPHVEPVFAHGSFGLGDVLWDGTATHVVDFDSAVLADPLLDVANFTAKLHYLEAVGELLPGHAAQLAGVFRDCYLQHVPWDADRRALDWWVASRLVHKQAFKCVRHLHADAAREIRHLLDEALRRTRGVQD